MALAFQMASLFYLLVYFRNEMKSNIIYSYLFAFLAVLSNFSFLNYFLPLLVIVNLINIFQLKHNIKSGFIYSIVYILITGLFLYEPIRKLKLNDSLYYGGDTGFYDDTLISLTKYTMYSSEVNELVYLVLNICLLLFLLVLVFSFLSDSKLFSLKNIFLALLTISISSIVAQVYLLGNLYVIDRGALFLYPLILFTFCFLLSDLKWKKIKNIIAAAILMFFVANAMDKMNTYKTATWFFDAHTVEILDEINSIGEKVNAPQKIDFSWPFQSSIGYYINKENYPYLEVVKCEDLRDGFNPNADYYIYLNKSLEKVYYETTLQHISNFEFKDTLKFFPNEGVLVYGL